MFDKLKEIKKLKDLQNTLKKEKIEVNNSGIRIIMNGGLEIEELEINSSLNKEDQEKILKSLMNEAIKKIQMVAAQKMSCLGGF